MVISSSRAPSNSAMMDDSVHGMESCNDRSISSRAARCSYPVSQDNERLASSGVGDRVTSSATTDSVYDVASSLPDASILLWRVNDHARVLQVSRGLSLSAQAAVFHFRFRAGHGWYSRTPWLELGQCISCKSQNNSSTPTSLALILPRTLALMSPSGRLLIVPAGNGRYCYRHAPT